MDSSVAVIGAGSWGTAVSGLVAQNIDQVTLWAHSDEVCRGINNEHVNPRYLRDYHIPANVHATSSLSEAVSGADDVIVVVPSSFVRDTCRYLSAFVSEKTPVVILAKGIEIGSNELMAEVAADELGSPARVAVLSGPNHAEEVCTGTMSAAVIASRDMQLSKHLQEIFLSPSFRAYVSDDIVGVEVCAAVKNVIAIACGVAVGLGAGDNTLAVIMTRGLAEISRVVNACGGQPLTCMGLAGMGDLIATCTSRHSRNRSYGEALVRGASVAEYETETHMVVEGARAAKSVFELAVRKGVDVPITRAVHGMLYEGLSIEDAMGELTARLPNEEFYGLGTSEARQEGVSHV